MGGEGRFRQNGAARARKGEVPVLEVGMVNDGGGKQSVRMVKLSGREWEDGLPDLRPVGGRKGAFDDCALRVPRVASFLQYTI